MKKILVWCLPLILIAVTVGITVFVIKSNSHFNKNIYATNLICMHEKLTLFEGSSYALNSTEFSVEPANCTEKIIFTTTNSNILEVNNSKGEILAKEVGTCSLIAYVKSSATENISKEIEIVVDKRNEDNPDKTNEEKTIICNLSEGFVLIEYMTHSTKDKLSITINQGEDLITISTYEHDNMTVFLNAAGTAKIIIDAPTKNIIITLIIN